MSNTFPSKTPPWARPLLTPVTQTLVDDGTISLDTDVTYLVKALGNPPAPATVVLPNGNYVRQQKRIFIPGDQISVSETFTVTGTFAGFTSLIFNLLASAAILEWDGTAWHWLGGNAVVQTT